MNPSLILISFVVGLSVILRGAWAADVPRVEALRVPDGGTYPQAQVDDRGAVHLIYVKGDPMRADVNYVRSDDGGRTFSEPMRVNSHPRSVIITGTVRGPHLAVGKGGRVHVAWMGSDEAQPKFQGKKAPMLYARTNDAADGFEPQRNVIQQHPGLDGGGSVAADDEGNVYVAWHAPNGGEDEASRDVWLARSRDEGTTFDAEVAVLPKKVGVCGCCGMRIHARRGGALFIAFRSAEAVVNRDVHLLVSGDYGRTFRIAAADPWNVGQCVMSTAAIATAADTTLAAWETKDQIQLATLSSGGANARVTPVTNARGKHPSIAANGRGQHVVAWAVGIGWNKGGSIAWQVFDDRGRALLPQPGHADGLPVWSVPAVVALPDGTFRIFY